MLEKLVGGERSRLHIFFLEGGSQRIVGRVRGPDASEKASHDVLIRSSFDNWDGLRQQTPENGQLHFGYSYRDSGFCQRGVQEHGGVSVFAIGGFNPGAARSAYAQSA